MLSSALKASPHQKDCRREPTLTDIGAPCCANKPLTLGRQRTDCKRPTSVLRMRQRQYLSKPAGAVVCNPHSKKGTGRSSVLISTTSLVAMDAFEEEERRKKRTAQGAFFSAGFQ